MGGAHRRLSLRKTRGARCRRVSPPNTTLSRDARGTESSIPKKDAFNQKHGRKAGSVSISRTIRHLSSKHHPPLASPFLGPNPVFEINPRGVGLRASPCRRPDSGPI